MLHQLLQKLKDLPTVVQGAAGSALFWLVLRLIEILSRGFIRAVDATGKVFNKKRKQQEYIYRRYTSRTGLLNFTEGYLMSLYFAMRGLLTGLMFCCIALFFGGSASLIWGICFTAAIVYLSSALTWVVPSRNWNSTTHGAHWQRVAELERELFGEVNEQTAKFVEQFAAEDKPQETKTSLHP